MCVYINIYIYIYIYTDTPYTTAPKYIKQILTDQEGEIDNNKIIVDDLNNPI